MKYHLSHCPVNPTLEYADSLEVGPEYTEIVSQGGGSTIDVGKWLAKKFNLPHTAIPTTTGTGSEVTKYCVLMVDGKKKTFTDEKFIPTSYKLDPSLVTSLPNEHTLASGLDAYSQAFESLWSKNATQESRTFALASIILIENNLRTCLYDPNNERARMNMLIGANLSGRAINITRTNVCHAISYPLTELYGIPHGVACAMSLKYFIWKALKTKFPFEDLVPKKEVDVEKIADIAIQSEKLNDCPFEITKEDIVTSLKAYSVV